MLFVLIIVGFRVYHSLKSRISTENGIQESSYVEISGIEQYLQIRGKDVNNPVILWLHGGPGFPLTYLDYYYQTDLEADYTVVCWEQRGCGRTRYKNESSGEMSGFKQILTAVTSPEMTLKDAKWFLFASNTQNICSSQKKIMDYMYYQFDVKDFTSEYDIPTCFIQGESDWTTPTDLVEEYYNGISAEQKKLVIIGNAGHTPFLDNREQFCKAAKEFLQNT